MIDDCYSVSNFDKQFFPTANQHATDLIPSIFVCSHLWDFSLHIFLRIIIKAKYIACNFFFYKNNDFTINDYSIIYRLLLS